LPDLIHGLSAVQRIQILLDVPQEPPHISQLRRPPAYWPSVSSRGAFVTLENVQLKYAPSLRTTVHGVSLEFQGLERVALVGHTGSGKSLLALSLLRFVDPVNGRILIDGLDISHIGVGDLRSHIVCNLLYSHETV
jgi:ABC-type multidrug transport system fused ATPase/permease subunit